MKSNKPTQSSVFGGSDVLTTPQLAADEVVTSIACGTLHTAVITCKKGVRMIHVCFIPSVLPAKNRVLSAGYGENYALGHGDR